MFKKNATLLILLSLLAATSCTIPGTAPLPATVATTPRSRTVETEIEVTLANNKGTEKDVTELTGTYPIVDTNQSACYDNTSVITCSDKGNRFYGQDAQFTSNAPSYTVNGDGTVTDNITGMMWQQSPDTDGDGDIDASDKLTASAAATWCENLDYAGYTDWELPTIKQLYSLIDFSGMDPSGYEGSDTSGLIPFIDTDTFDFAYGDTNAGERIIDMQYASSTWYVGSEGLPQLFGVNFADGRIKGYWVDPNREKTFAVQCVRQTGNYGINDFSDNGDGTITDNATSLMWAQNDSETGMDWEHALAWVEDMNAASYLGNSDWRLPNAKELQSIVDYSRSPDSTNSAAIDPLFNTTSIINEDSVLDYGFYWSSTTHINYTQQPGRSGVYVSFGRALGYFHDEWQDVHGAGAQRGDPKSGDPDELPSYFGPQGDVSRVYNFVRLVRDGDVSDTPPEDLAELKPQATFPVVEGNSDAPTSSADAQPHPDLTQAAQILGVTEQQLKDALGDPAQCPPDIALAAQRLGLSEKALIEALGVLPPNN